MTLFQTTTIRIDLEPSTIPWVKIFSQHPYKELSDCDESTRNDLWQATLLCEKAMRTFYNPTKINIASFGNYVPHVHIHVMARFAEDSHYPESMWGVKQRESQLVLPDIALFCEELCKVLKGSL